MREYISKCVMWMTQTLEWYYLVKKADKATIIFVQKQNLLVPGTYQFLNMSGMVTFFIHYRP